ncbi:MAG: peptidoglycan-binding domain-containing protein [Pseudomonadota bacterium]
MPWERPETGAEPVAQAPHGLDAVPVVPEFTQPVELQPTRELVAEVQETLTRLGYRPGPVDGLLGPKTHQAIELYQDSKGLWANGRLTDQVVNALREERVFKAQVPAKAAAPKSAEAPASAGPEAAPTEAVAEAALPTPPLGPSDPMPAYQAGTRYIYSDGEVRSILEVTGQEVRWRSNRGATIVSHANFVVPPTSWFSSQERGKRSFSKSHGELWPGAPGQGVRFEVSSETQQGVRAESAVHSKEFWACRNEGRAEVELALGAFETRKLVCERRARDGVSALTRTWYYEPEIGHYLVFEERQPGQPEVRSELVAIQPGSLSWPPAARAGLGWAIQHALDSAQPGEESHWRSSAVDAEVTIVPGETFALAEQQHCRRYQQVWMEGDLRQLYPAVACADSAGHWVIPGLEAGELVAKNRS